ncbi:hypothetical protein VTN02DRAFT_4732 [Thermoascus thermophilus]
MPIVHVVLLRFKPDVAPSVVEATCQQFLSLQERCVRPATQTPYLRSLVGGRENSPEGLANGFTHVFVSEFESEDDRRFYLEEDPAHRALATSLGGVVEQVQAVDFVPGVF